MKQTKTCLMLILFGISLITYSQVGIGTASPNPNAMLDVTSTSKGLLIPRMTESQMNAIPSPAAGLMVYCTDCNGGAGCLTLFLNTVWRCGGGECTTPAPLATSGSGATLTQIHANWNAVAGATSYSIDVSTASDFSGFVTGFNNLSVGNVLTYTIPGLTPSTPYFYRVRAISVCGLSGNSNTTTYATKYCGAPITDSRDSKSYNTVLIGTQCWMAQNLNVGTRITPGDQTNNGILEKYCYADLESNCTIYGGLYQWDEAMQYVTTEGVQGICPTGWHLPADAEFTTIATYLGGVSVASGPMKETGTTHWLTPNTGATNSSGFTGLGGGGFQPSHAQIGFNTQDYMWTSKRLNATSSYYRFLYYTDANLYNGATFKTYGFSVRCIQD
jgi:uncharacterized protein (TIGR02145 family)